MIHPTLVHVDHDRKTDDALAGEADAFFQADPARQVVAYLIHMTRAVGDPWARKLLARFSCVALMRALIQRPDLRQKITTTLTGFLPKAARHATSGHQGILITAVIESGEIMPVTFVNMLDPRDLVVYLDLRMLICVILEIIGTETLAKELPMSDLMAILDLVKRALWPDVQQSPAHVEDPATHPATDPPITRRPGEEDGTTCRPPAPDPLTFPPKPALVDGKSEADDGPQTDPPKTNVVERDGKADEEPQTQSPATAATARERDEDSQWDLPALVVPKDHIQPTIEDGAFEQARERSATLPPAEQGLSSGSSLVVLVCKSKITEETGVSFSEDMSNTLAENLKTVLVDGTWLEDKAAMLEVIVTTLTTLNPDAYKKDDEWQEDSLPSLRNVFLRELERGSASKGAAARLRRSIES